MFTFIGTSKITDIDWFNFNSEVSIYECFVSKIIVKGKVVQLDRSLFGKSCNKEKYVEIVVSG